jgi:hypothetical protein
MKTFAAGLVLLLAVLAADRAVAEQGQCVRDFWGNCQGRQAVHYRHCSKDFWGRCKDGRPPWRRSHWRRDRDDDRDRVRDDDRRHRRDRSDIDRGAFCHPRRRVVGEERPGKEKALKAADDAWMGAVRYDHGERYQDLNHARDVRHNCDPSSTSSILKRVHYRCVVEATPCRAPTGNVEARVRRYDEDRNEESDDDDRRKR